MTSAYGFALDAQAILRGQIGADACGCHTESSRLSLRTLPWGHAWAFRGRVRHGDPLGL
jgi:hypothetical protein